MAGDAPVRDLVLYLARRPSFTVRRELAAIAAALPGDAALALMSYSPAGPARDARVRVGLRSVAWHVYDAASLRALPYPGKLRHTESRQWAIMPGNLDLLNLAHWRRFPALQYLWLIEDDVRFSGDWSALFAGLRDCPADLLATCMRRHDDEPTWPWWTSLHGPDGQPATSLSLLAGFLPFHRVSAAALAALDAALRQGWSGHHEVLWPTLAAHAGLVVEDFGGNGMLSAPPRRGTLYHSPDTFRYRPPMDAPGTMADMLWHPVKPPPLMTRARAALRGGR